MRAWPERIKIWNSMRWVGRGPNILSEEIQEFVIYMFLGLWPDLNSYVFVIYMSSLDFSVLYIKHFVKRNSRIFSICRCKSHRSNYIKSLCFLFFCTVYAIYFYINSVTLSLKHILWNTLKKKKWIGHSCTVGFCMVLT